MLIGNLTRLHLYLVYHGWTTWDYYCRPLSERHSHSYWNRVIIIKADSICTIIYYIRRPQERPGLRSGHMRTWGWLENQKWTSTFGSNFMHSIIIKYLNPILKADSFSFLICRNGPLRIITYFHNNVVQRVKEDNRSYF